MKTKLSPGARALLAAFTLVELLVVIAIIGILAAIIIPVAGRVRYTARIAQCASNLRQIALGFELYANDHKNNYPPAQDGSAYWPYLMRDYIPTNSLYGGGATRLNAYHCPESLARGRSTGSTHYGVNKILYKDAQDKDQLTTPVPKARITIPTRTILLGDSCQQTNGNMASRIAWGGGNLPGTIQTHSADSADKTHTDGSANIAYADGHVKFFKNSYLLDAPACRDRGPADLWRPDK
ncbi:MAG: prepilin-type N-terminal cleavage/methylation domain-containing protein [Opitutaceae bacterium]|jgi:prepilin-type N-terminal cleavage/methylation domain-containing protein/prepilin-type processing-associated H-X9-DG protein|nr:prepilin-type N-terminal cleavage/methylation domain-containing protein [Opitutaceae bacterium]